MGPHVPIVPSAAHVTAFMDAIATCNNAGLGGRKYCRLMCAGKHVGNVRDEVWPHLAAYTETFRLDAAAKTVEVVCGDGEAAAAVSARCAAAMADLRRRDVLVALRGWRDELYPVAMGFAAAPLFLVERAASLILGTRRYGVHLNVFVEKGEGADRTQWMWIARRSPTKQRYPNMLDQAVAGGIAAGENVRDALVRECAEEAGIEKELACEAVAVDVVSFMREDNEGIDTGTQYVYDLEVTPDFVPRNLDGEVTGFQCLSLAQVYDAIGKGEFKPDIVLNIISFLLRRGHITRDACPFYEDLVHGIHRNLTDITIFDGHAPGQ